MTGSYLFSSPGLVTLAHLVRDDTLFAFSLDVILTQDIAEHSAINISEPAKTTLQRLMNVVKVAVLSCRSRKDAMAVLGFEPHLLIGNYGIELPSQENCRNWQNVKLCLKLREQLYDMLGHVQGIEIEFLGESISVHYRKAGNPEKALSLINAAIEKLKPLPQTIEGMFVVNLLPCEAINRGETLLSAMRLFGSRKSIYFGADGADEDVFRLKHADVFGIHVGKNDETSAAYYLHTRTELLGVLNSMIALFETQ